MDNEKLLSTKEAAKFLGVDRKTIQNYRKRGILTPDLEGKNNSVLYKESQLIDVASFLSSSGESLLKFNPKTLKKFAQVGNRSEISSKFSPQVGNRSEISSETALTVVKEKNVSIFPSQNRIEANDKLTEKVFSLLAETYYNMVTYGSRFDLIEKKNHKKYGDIFSYFWLELIDGYTDKSPLNQFDRAVLAACISEWAANNRYTTPSIIYRHLTGKIGSDAEPKPELRAAILKSIDKMMCTQIKVDMSDTCQKLGYNDGKPFKMTSTILPCTYAEGIMINGHATTVIKLLDEPLLLTVTSMKKQMLNYYEPLLNVPKQKNSVDVIAVKNYTLQRIQEIIKHKMTPIITFADVFEKCRLDNLHSEQKRRVRKTIIELAEHLKNQGEILAFEVHKKGNAFYSISFTYSK